MSNWPWNLCRLDDCKFRTDTPADQGGADIMCMHYQSHIAEDLQAMRVSQFEMLKDIRVIATSGFLNPRHPGEGFDDVQERIERRRNDAVRS